MLKKLSKITDLMSRLDTLANGETCRVFKCLGKHTAGPIKLKTENIAYSNLLYKIKYYQTFMVNACFVF